MYTLLAPPFQGIEGTGEGLGLLALVLLVMGLFFLLEQKQGESPVVRIIIAGLSLYLITITEISILIACFAGLALLNIVRILQ